MTYIENKDTYYKYEDYCFYRNIYDTVDGISGTNSLSTNPIILKYFRSHQEKNVIRVSKKIKGYLKHFVTKDIHKSNNRCAYINYILNDEIQGLIYKAKSYTFEMFINYIKSDAELKNNTCFSNIMYLEKNIYDNMKKLYDLYNKYEVIYENNRYGMDTHWCTDLVDLVKDFNTTVSEKDKRINVYLFKELKYIKCLLENLELIKQKKCAGIEELSSPYMDSKEDIVQCIDQVKTTARPEGHEESQTSERYAEERGTETGIPGSDKPRASITLPLSGAMAGMFCLLLYKYTPVGNKLRHLVQGKNSISKNMHDEKYKLYVNNFENQNNDLEGRRYNVSYYSVDNS
ncbi:PIR protein [Plasmodium vivax]|uniref:VIR protein n=1 Tax=Plasmodium vivax TaxID=5855 RepID=A0A565A531_PLAVI|nr:PIR protein [Plasmodium vivax]